ncbi:MAG: energy-coupling factor transporter transmembrane protein EcfT, partial [Bacillati bacterium ANGP1]
MSEFELLRNITIGQYLPTGSYLHRLNPQAKIVAAILVTAAVSFTPTLVGNVCLLVACAVIVRLGRIPPSYALRGLIPAIPFLVILAVLQLLLFGRNFDPTSPVIFQWGWVVVTAAVGRVVLISAARFVELLIVTSVFTLSTRITELTHGI